MLYPIRFVVLGLASLCLACSGSGSSELDAGSVSDTAPPADAGTSADAGSSDAGTSSGGCLGEKHCGPAQLLDRLTPSSATLNGRSFDELHVRTLREPAANFPDHVDFPIDPTRPGETTRLRLHWGVMTSGTIRLPSVRQVTQFLGAEVMQGLRPGECSGQPDRNHIYGCATQCSPSPEARQPGATTRAEAEAFVASLREVRLLNPFMIAYPVDNQDRSTLRTQRASIFPNQFSTTGADGYSWSGALDGSNDTISTTDTWATAWDVSARNGAVSMWLGDVVFPKQWGLAEAPTNANPAGLSCGGNGEPMGWGNANDYTTFLNVLVAKMAVIYGDEELPDEVLALYPAMPYMRATSSAITYLKRFQERQLSESAELLEFSTSGNSKGGFGCTFSTVADRRVKLGVCGVFDIFDLQSPTGTLARFMSDWGLCQSGGRDRNGCSSGNMPAAPGAEGSRGFALQNTASDSYFKTWELASFAQHLDVINPDSLLWWHNASTDFHFPAGSNDAFWSERPPPSDQWRLYHRMNADHGGFSVMPPNGPEGMTTRDWVHGPDKWISYRNFYDDREAARVVYTERPRVVTQGGTTQVVAQVRADSDRGIAGVQAWIAAGTDRDFSFCSGMEGMQELGQLRCYGTTLCKDIEPQCVTVEGPNESNSCPGDPGLVQRVQSSVVLPIRGASPHYCTWRRGQNGVPLWRQCVDPLGEGINGNEAPHERLEARVDGTYNELGWAMPATRGSDQVPRLRPFASVGDNNVEQLFSDYGFAYPYERSAGDYTYRDSGMFVPRVMVVQQQPDGTVLADLAWTLPQGSSLTHFAVAVEAWDERPSPRDIPDVVFTDIATLAPADDPSIIRCD
jgi:hypothetical protein